MSSQHPGMDEVNVAALYGAVEGGTADPATVGVVAQLTDLGVGPDDGDPMIRYSHSKEYAYQWAVANTSWREDAPWPANCIDWEEAVGEFYEDYGTVVWGNTPYYIRQN